MPYAEGRIYNDADSHIMETKDWLFQYADPKVRPKLAPIDFTMCGGTATETLVTALPTILEKRRNDPAAMARAEANVLERKSWHALGGIDPAERSKALDLLGYNRQLVFQSMATTQFWGDMGIQKFFDPEILYGGARALNRGMADFCSDDRRLRGVGFVPLNDPELAVREIKQAAARRMRRHLGAGDPAARSVADPSRHGPGLGDSAGVWICRSFAISAAVRSFCARAS